MKPPYQLTSSILKAIASISEQIGEVKAGFLVKKNPQLRKQNRIKTIHASLQIEGNSLSEAQVSALIENKRVLGPAKDIKEVQNAVAVYDAIGHFNCYTPSSFLKAHQQLMQGLVDRPGAYRTEGVGIVKGTQVTHLAPPAHNVPHLMNDLFQYVKSDPEIALIKSCVFHYEMEFIHPFIDGNGRMGRFWQTLILMQEHSFFQYIPFENLVAQSQKEYYGVLSQCDKAGSSTLFIEYMLRLIDQALTEVLQLADHKQLNQLDRLQHFVSLGANPFSRKEYLQVFKTISSAAASRDLKKGVELGLFSKEGDKRMAVYHLKS